MSIFRAWLYALWLPLLLGALQAPSVLAQDTYTPIASPRGYQPHQGFEMGEIDTVDTASGHLTVRIPLGQVYEVGPKLSYQVQVVHNSTAWDAVTLCPEGGCQPPIIPRSVFAMPNPGSNAGLGWELHFGKLYAPVPADGMNSANRERWPNRDADPSEEISRWMYVAPDGGRHYLYSLDGRDNGTASSPVRYSKDGRFLRLQVSGTTADLEFPNGLIRRFEKVDMALGTDFCGQGITGCWRFSELRDLYGNRMWIEYSESSTEETWTVKDSTGREHTITFDLTDAGTSGGDSVAELATQDGDEWGDLRRKVKTVELAAFDASTATYGFGYSAATVGRGCPHDSSFWSTSANVLTTQILDSITVPGALPWTFETWAQNQTACSILNGRLQSVTLPTRGKIAYTYANTWEVPTRCSYTSDPEAETFYRVPALATRERLYAGGASAGKWSYTTDLFPPASQLVASGSGCTRAQYRMTTVDGPDFDGDDHVRTEYFHSVYQGPQNPLSTTASSAWQVTDAGLPYSKHVSTGGTGLDQRFLSRRIYECDGDACGSPVRSVYLRYVSEWRSCSPFDGAGCYVANPLLLAERTVFHDDQVGGAARWSETASSTYRGIGRFATQTTSSNFGSPSVSTTTTTVEGTNLSIHSTTGYVNVGTPTAYLPSTSESWLLTPFTTVTTSRDGVSHVSEYTFDAAGSLTCQRRWRNSSARSSTDQVVKLVRGSVAGVNLGLPTEETVTGGDGANLSTGGLCAVSTSSADGQKYVFDHSYQHLQLSKTVIGSFPNRYEATIDRNTGLPSSITNAAGQSTGLVYDALGRLTAVNPTSSLLQASTSYEYSHPSNGNAYRVMRRQTGGTTLIYEQAIYDGFGRVVRELGRRPLGMSSHEATDQRTSYDTAGHVTSRTTRQRNASLDSSKAWKWSQFDAFGRPGRVVAPDGQVETRSYAGVRSATSTVQIATGEGSTASRSRTTVHDAQGQAVSITTSEHTTRFTYDPSGQRLTATRVLPDVADQVRTYAWDGRGFLAGETLPEQTTTFTRDALGLVRTSSNGGSILAYGYDGDARPTSIRSGGTTWKSWQYGTENGSSGGFTNYQKGKVITASRYNAAIPGTATGVGSEPIEVREEYAYFGGGWAGPSRQRTQIRYPDRSGDAAIGARFETGFGYDPLGHLASVSYPACIAEPSTGLERCNDSGADRPGPAHTVSLSYNQGRLYRSASSLGPWAEHGYHANGQLARVDYSNEVDGLYAEGTAGLLRHGGRSFELGASTHFETGSYTFDGAGNVASIGPDLYSYDGVGRLRSATVKAGGAGRRVDVLYDPADNITSVTTDSGAPFVYEVDLSTNRYLGANGSMDLEYDGAGNLVALGDWGDGRPIYALSWDPFDMQTAFVMNGPSAADPPQIYGSVYGPGDLRILATDTSTGQAHWTLRGRGGEILREYQTKGETSDETWIHERDFIYGAEGAIASRHSNGTERYFHTDHLGTVRLLTTAAGTVLSRHDFYPFGAEIDAEPVGALLIDGFESGDLTAWGDGPDELAVKYTGHERDLHRNSDYMRGRTCLYPIRRFASPDPGRDGWNLYAYTLNNPVKYVDPDGEAVRVAGLNEPDYARNAAVREDFKADLARRLPFIGGKVGGFVDTVFLSSLFPASPGELAANFEPASMVMPFSPGSKLGGIFGSGRAGARALPALAETTQARLLASSNRQVARGGVTAVGRAIQKHASRPGSFFAAGRNAAENAQIGDDFLRGLLQSPEKVVSTTNTAAFGPVIRVRLPSGVGAQFKEAGEFIGLLEPFTPR